MDIRIESFYVPRMIDRWLAWLNRRLDVRGLRVVAGAGICLGAVMVLGAEPGGGAASATCVGISHADAAAADRLVQEKKVVILDIRTPKEHGEARIAGSKNVDFNAADFEAQLSKLDRSQKYLLHCATGRRTTAALPVFERLGFKDVVHLDGGLRAWMKEGKPVERPK